MGLICFLSLYSSFTLAENINLCLLDEDGQYLLSDDEMIELTVAPEEDEEDGNNVDPHSQVVELPLEDAVKAVSILKTKKELIYFCLPCGESIGENIEIQSADLEAGSNEKVKVSINGKPIDLAYAYINYRKYENKNVASILGIKTNNVPTEYDQNHEHIYARWIKKIKSRTVRKIKDNCEKSEKAALIQKYRTKSVLE